MTKIINVNVTLDDWKNGIRRSTTHCAFASAIGRHFPGNIVYIRPEGVVCVISALPEWVSLDPDNPGHYTILPKEQRPSNWEEEALRLRRFRGRLAEPQQLLISIFDKGVLSQAALTFPLTMEEVIQPTHA